MLVFIPVPEWAMALIITAMDGLMNSIWTVTVIWRHGLTADYNAEAYPNAEEILDWYRPRL